jgi:hypothetical protein
MSKPIIHIQFASPAPPELMHRVLNFMEDVYRATRDAGTAETGDIDHYSTGLFIVRIASARRIGEVSSLVGKLLKQHHLESEAVVSRADRA